MLPFIQTSPRILCAKDISRVSSFKSMEIKSTMYQILDTLVPWWHLAQVTSKGESLLLGVHSGSWNNFFVSNLQSTRDNAKYGDEYYIIISLFNPLMPKVGQGFSLSPHLWSCFLSLACEFFQQGHTMG